MTREQISTHDRLRCARRAAARLTVLAAHHIPARAWIKETYIPVGQEREFPLWIAASESVVPHATKVGACAEVAGILPGLMGIDIQDIDIEDIIETVSAFPEDAEFSSTVSDCLDLEDETAVRSAAEEAVDILTKHRVFFEWAARRLHDECCITDGMAEEAFRAHENHQAITV